MKRGQFPQEFLFGGVVEVGCYGGSDKVGLRKKTFERSSCQSKWDLGEINRLISF